MSIAITKLPCKNNESMKVQYTNKAFHVGNGRGPRKFSF